jgi:hypothetical protein
MSGSVLATAVWTGLDKSGHGLEWSTKTSKQPTVPPPGCDISSGAWVVDNFTYGKGVATPVNFVWMPAPGMTLATVATGQKNTHVQSIYMGYIAAYWHTPWEPDYEAFAGGALASVLGARLAWVDGTGAYQQVNCAFHSDTTGPERVSDPLGQTHELPAVVAPSTPPGGGAAGGQWYMGTYGLFSYASPATVAAAGAPNNNMLWLLLGGGVAAAGTGYAVLA